MMGNCHACLGFPSAGIKGMNHHVTVLDVCGVFCLFICLFVLFCFIFKTSYDAFGEAGLQPYKL